MKRIYLFLVFCFLLSTFIIISGETITNSKSTTSKITLSGNYPPVKSRSLVEPVQAFIIDQSSIEVDFYDSLGTIDLLIYDEAGNAVYQQSVNASTGQQLSIDISFFDAGVYTIEFVNSQTDLFGAFEI